VLFGIVGYVLKKLDYPLAPLVLAVVLGDKMESAFRQSMIGPQASLAVFWSNPLVGSITTVALAMLAWPLVKFGRRHLVKALGGSPVGAP
jgi:putative tricarboxylic transport membrane protein